MYRYIKRSHYALAMPRMQSGRMFESGSVWMYAFDIDSFHVSFMKNVRKQGKRGFLLVEVEIGNRKIISMVSVAHRKIWKKGCEI